MTSTNLKPKSLFRFGKNFPWRGRQALCQQDTTKIESEILQQIGSAVTVSDFNKLFLQTFHHLPPSNNSRTCISNEKNSFDNPLTCHIGKGEVLSNRKPVTSTAHHHHHYHHNNRNCKGRARYNNSSIITSKVGGNECFNDDTENLEWYIELASRCYDEGFQWHMNYLSDCTRRGNLLKRRRLTGAVSKSNRIATQQHQQQRSSDGTEYQSSFDGDEIVQLSVSHSSDERFRDDASDCKIRININQLAANSNNTKPTNNHNARKRSIYSYVTHLNKKINIMNSSGYSIDAINITNDTKSTDRLNEVFDNFGSLNISCGSSVLPQIVLTDFSSIDSMPRTNTLLLTPSTVVSSSSAAEQFNISGTKSQSHAECLSIPAEYYRNETRPC